MISRWRRSTRRACVWARHVDHVEADAILALHAQGEALGVVVWPAIRPSAGVGSGDVMPDQAEMAIVGAIGDSPTPPPSPPVAPTSASTDLAPLPPPPPPPVRAEVAAKPAEPVRRVGLLKQILIANALILLILGIFAFRGTETARGLVCEPTGALHEIGIAKTLVGCAEKAAVNPEETAYNDYLQCVPGQPACAQKRCGDAYLSAFANGAHATKVRAASAASQQACEADAEKQSAAEVFAAFNECMRTTPNVCNRSQCVDRYRHKLTTEPYASSLRQAAETAAGDCRRSQEDAAYAQFNSCVAGADACDAARCASAFTSGFPNSAYVSRVLQAAENAARTCRQATEPQGLADCDQYAANRFDADRPTNASFVEDAATLSDESIETGLRACASADVNMSGGRRVYLQRGRLLAERAVDAPGTAISLLPTMTWPTRSRIGARRRGWVPPTVPMSWAHCFREVSIGRAGASSSPLICPRRSSMVQGGAGRECQRRAQPCRLSVDRKWRSTRCPACREFFSSMRSTRRRESRRHSRSSPLYRLSRSHRQGQD